MEGLWGGACACGEGVFYDNENGERVAFWAAAAAGIREGPTAAAEGDGAACASRHPPSAHVAPSYLDHVKKRCPLFQMRPEYSAVHDALKQVVLEKDNEIEDLNLQLTQIKNMEFSSNLDVVEGVLNDDVVLDDLYDIGAFTNSVKDIESPSFSKEVQFPDGILKDFYSLCGLELDVNVLNGVYDAKEMVLTDDYASLLQVIDDGEVGFLEDASIFLCDVVDGGDDVDVLISHWFYVFMLD
ncbi:hypothetical protein L7F22_063769 [Adiantum nelumboides]|nr:hypothetical protein [Adiantum nelumboides]